MNSILTFYWLSMYFYIVVNAQKMSSVINRNGLIRRENCVSTCFNLKPSNVVLEISDFNKENTKLITIFYKCSIEKQDVYDPYFNKNILQLVCNWLANSRYVKLCDNRVEYCGKDLQKIENNSKKYKTKSVMTVPVIIPKNFNQIHFKLTGCESVTFIGKYLLFEIRNTIVFVKATKSFERKISIPNMNQFSVNLSLWKLTGEHVVDIEFIFKKKSSLDSAKSTKKNNITDFSSKLDEILNEKISIKKKLVNALSLITKMPPIYKKKLNSLKSNERAKRCTTFILKVQNVLKNISIGIKTKNDSYKDSSDSFFIYSSLVTKNKVLISLENKTNEIKKQFVELNLKEKDKIKENSGLVSNFILYKNMDIMNEFHKIQLKRKNKTLIIDDKDKGFAENRIERHKNSDIMYLSLSRHINITVNFKLKSINELTSPSWLYVFEEECGYLDKNSDWKWSVDGCKLIEGEDNQNYCQCDHLSNFAMLFSIKTINTYHVIVTRYLSLISGIINIISLVLFLIFILHINTRDKLRLDQLNIAICLLSGTFVFLISIVTSRNEITCKITALLTQFFFLSGFNWKLVYGVNVIRMTAFLKYENENKLSKYRIASIVTSYGVSLLIVILSGILQWKQYGKVADDVCWIESQSAAFLTFIIPIGIILAINIILLTFISIILIRHFIKSRQIKVNKFNESMIFFQLAVTMGFTWIPSYFAIIYLWAIYMWIICFPLQGLFLFLFIVVMNKENRDKVSSYMKNKYNSLALRHSKISQSKTKSTFISYSVSKNLSSFDQDGNETISTLLNSKTDSKLLFSEASGQKFIFKNFINKENCTITQSAESIKNNPIVIDSFHKNENEKVLLVPGNRPMFFNTRRNIQ